MVALRNSKVCLIHVAFAYHHASYYMDISIHYDVMRKIKSVLKFSFCPGAGVKRTNKRVKVLICFNTVVYNFN